MKSSTAWLRVSYWVGSIADGVVATSMFAQALFACGSPVNNYVPEIPYRYAMGLAGSLMLGWTILLLWADRDPVERRGVLLISSVVILGLIGSSLLAVSTDFVRASSMVPVIVFQIGLIVLFSASYVASRRQTGGRDGGA